MRLKYIYLLVLFCCNYTNCIAQQSEIDGVTIFTKSEEAPAGATLLGKIKIGDMGFKVHCGYNRVLEEAAEKTKEKGGNLLKITELKNPGAMGTSDCYRLHGQAYYCNDIAAVNKKRRQINDSIEMSLIPDTMCSFLYVFRPKGGYMAYINYRLHVNDSDLCTMKNNTAYIIRLHKNGPAKVWTQVEKAWDEVTINAKAGHVYFLRSTLEKVVMFWKPRIVLVDIQQGLNEFNEIMNDR